MRTSLRTRISSAAYEGDRRAAVHRRRGAATGLRGRANPRAVRASGWGVWRHRSLFLNKIKNVIDMEIELRDNAADLRALTSGQIASQPKAMTSCAARR